MAIRVVSQQPRVAIVDQRGLPTDVFIKWLQSELRAVLNQKTDAYPTGSGNLAEFDTDGNLTSTGHIAPSGDVVGTTDVQTLTNKTLILPVIADFTNAAHTHQNTAGGGKLDHGLALNGLTDDDHTQYLLLAGRALGQTVAGGSATGEDLILNSNALKDGKIYFGDTNYLDEANGIILFQSGTAPVSSPADSAQLWVADQAVGNACWKMRTENDSVLMLYQQAHIADASESNAVTDPGDSPADADALRDDLVTNTIPSVESALNALGQKINAILAAMENTGFLATS